MPKQFYTEKDIEDLFERGTTSLEAGENVVLTELAFEKARSLGMKLVTGRAENPPSAPVRPYLSQAAVSRRPAAAPAAAPCERPAPGEKTGPIERRIKEAVAARLGAQVDPKLLDVIIKRVLVGTGVK
jgi:hypothetical protein